MQLWFSPIFSVPLPNVSKDYESLAVWLPKLSVLVVAVTLTLVFVRHISHERKVGISDKPEYNPDDLKQEKSG